MRRLPFYIRIIVLVVLVIVKNFIILALTPRGITKSSIKKHKKGEVMAYVRLAFACSVLLGTAWVFGILAITSPRNVFQWLFCICNSLQGLLIFILCTLQNPEARKQWMRVFRLHSTGKYSMKTDASKL